MAYNYFTYAMYYFNVKCVMYLKKPAVKLYLANELNKGCIKVLNSFENDYTTLLRFLIGF